MNGFVEISTLLIHSAPKQKSNEWMHLSPFYTRMHGEWLRFPSMHFGKLFGAVMALSAVVSLLQYPCFTLIKGPLGGDPLYVNIALTVLSLLAFINPLYVYLHCRRRAAQRASSNKSASS